MDVKEAETPQIQTAETRRLMGMFKRAREIIESQNKEINELSKANEQLKLRVNRRIACQEAEQAKQERDKAILMLKAEENEALENYENYEEQLRQLRGRNEVLRSALESIAAINIDDKYDKFNRPLIWDIVTTARKTLDFTKEDDNG